jgi:hypothetical protein
VTTDSIYHHRSLDGRTGLDSTVAWSDDPARRDLRAEVGAYRVMGGNPMRHILEGTIARRNFIASLGGAAVVGLMSHEARADALEGALTAALDTPETDMTSQSCTPGTKHFPTVAEIDAQVPTRSYRRAAGSLLVNTQTDGKVERLAEMPPRPTLLDFFERRFMKTRNHCLQSANKALHSGADEEIILACFVHDTVQELIHTDHGFWGAQMYEPYVPARTAFAIRYHAALRFYPDAQAGYCYPDEYREIFGIDYVPPPHIEASYRFARSHRWYEAPRTVTVCDLYAFDPKAVVKIDPFVEIVARHFKQPSEGLGNDNSTSAHMWRTLANPDLPL